MYLHLNKEKHLKYEWSRSDVTGWWTFMCDEVTPLTIPTSNLWLGSKRVNTDTRASAVHCRFKSFCPSLCGKEQSRESSLSPSPWHTQRENGSFGRPARGRKNGAQRGGPCREGGGEGRRGGDSAKGYTASIPAKGSLLHSPWWIASRLYQPPILKLFMSFLAMFGITDYCTITFYRALCIEYLDVLYLPECAVCNIMHILLFPKM